jgi:flagellar basal-body rod modification protein FlgD
MVIPISTGGSESLSLSAIQSQQTDFAKYLASQLQNQNPFAPVSVLSLLQDQLSVSQIQSQLINNLALSNISIQTSQNLLFSVGQAIGKTIHYADDSLTLASGKDTIKYKLESAASTLEIEIFDSNGNQVKSSAISALGNSAPKAAGDNTFNLDTQNASLSGDYTYNITAKDSKGKLITATPFTVDTIQAGLINDNVVHVKTSNNAIISLLSVLMIL